MIRPMIDVEDAMSDATSPAAESDYGTPVELHEAEHRLARQMKALPGPLQQAPDLAARMSNLVVYCNRRDTADRITA